MHSASADARRRTRTVARTAASLGLVLGLAGAPGLGRADDADGADDVAAPVAAAAASAPLPGASQPAGFVAGPRSLAIEAAVGKLRDDPLLSGRHKEHRLEWQPKPSRQKKVDTDPSWLAWFASLARFINDTSRFLLYGIVLVLVALLLVSGRRLVQLRAFRRRAAAAAAVSHVRDLDVRPESLPPDVGAAAWALWQAGQVPAALSLLYRGALSRLIHRWHVPIAASTTEGECLELARGRLEPGAQRYLTQVVRAWEANSYGNRVLSSAMGETLCSGFATRLDAAPPSEEAA
jgi:hypothetical protein